VRTLASSGWIASSRPSDSPNGGAVAKREGTEA
jgi:hypothetical protein